MAVIKCHTIGVGELNLLLFIDAIYSEEGGGVGVDEGRRSPNLLRRRAS